MIKNNTEKPSEFSQILAMIITIYLYHTHINIWYTCNKTGKTQNAII